MTEPGETTGGAGRGPRSAAAIAGDATTPTEPLPWDEAQRRLAGAMTYWSATTVPGGRPHVRPVFAVWVDGSLFTTSGAGARKARNVASEDRCSFSLADDHVDLVLEGRARPVTDANRLQQVAGAYHDKYGWPVTVVDGAFDAPFGAPTAGPPPYQVYEVRPETVYAFGTDEDHAPRTTRWRF